MKGYPKHMKTKGDYFNCLAMVQAGELEAAGLSEALDALEASRYITTNILEVQNVNNVLVMYCNEAAADTAYICGDVSGTIAAVKHIKSTQDDVPDETQLTLTAEIAKDAKTISVYNSAEDVLARVGITEEEIAAIREVLKNYE